MKELKKRYEELSSYVAELEKKIINIQILLNITDNIKPNSHSFIRHKQDILNISHCINTINNYYVCQTSHWLNKDRNTDYVSIRYIFFNLLIKVYGFSSNGELAKILTKYDYKINRTVLIHAKRCFEDHLVLNTSRSKLFIKQYNEIKQLL